MASTTGGTLVLEKLRCKECGADFRRLGNHLRSKHGMSTEKYLEKHPQSLLEVPGTRTRSEECRQKQSEAASRRWADPGERAAQSVRLTESAPWKGKTLSKEHREAISRGGLGVSHIENPENQALKGQRGAVALEQMRSRPGYSQRLSVALRKRAEWDENMGFRNPETFKKGWETRFKNGTLAPIGCGRGIQGFRKGLDHYTRSCLEANFAQILIAQGIPYLYEPVVTKLPSGKVYIPDFYLESPLLPGIAAGWVELKGWRTKEGLLPGDSEKKIREFEEYTGEPVLVIVQSDPLWKNLSSQFMNEVIWETPRSNLRTHPDKFGRQGDDKSWR